MAQYKLHKVNTLPVTPQPNAIYFEKYGTSEFKIYVTDSGGAAYTQKSGQRSVKIVSNTTQYTPIAADYTDFILVFDADTSGGGINIMLNQNVAPNVDGELIIYSAANHVLNFVQGTGVTLKTTAGNLLNSANDGDSIAVLGVRPLVDVNTLAVYGTLEFETYLDDIQFFANLASFPATGNTEIVYVARDTNTFYTWDGSIYSEVAANGGTGSVDKNYLHNQGTPATTWSINHNLNKYPAVQVFDSGNSMVIGDVVYDDLNNITITFSAAFSGKATLN
jgi:hypothetical protein